MKRRELLKSTVISGAGILFTGQLVSASGGNAHKSEAASENEGTILTKKRILGSGKAAITVPALSLG